MTRETKITLGILIAVLIVAGLLAWYVHHRSVVRQETAQTPAEQAAFQTPYTTLAGDPMALSNLPADTIVVLVWASWCPSCTALLSEFADLSTQYNEDEVQFVALNRAESPDIVSLYIARMLPTTVADEVLILLDQHDTLYTSLAGKTMPELYIYNEHNQVTHRFSGVIDMAAVQSAVAATTE